MKKKINITVAGGLGRMGQLLIKHTNKDKNLKLHSVTEYKEFQKDPVKYYNKHLKEIESSLDYAGGGWFKGKRIDNSDLFASLPYDVDVE